MATQDQIFLGNIHVTNAAAQSQLYAGNGAMSATTMRCHEQQYTFRYQHRGSDNSPSSRTGCAVMKAGSTDHFAFSAQFRRGRVKIRDCQVCGKWCRLIDLPPAAAMAGAISAVGWAHFSVSCPVRPTASRKCRRTRN